VIYRAELSTEALRELHGFPREAFKALTEVMGVVVENPYDPLRTLPTSDEQVRRPGALMSFSDSAATCDG
jgi:hypothetical protein